MTSPSPIEPLDQLIEERIKIASTQTKSDDPIVQLAWTVDGLDLWHRTDGKRGHSPSDTRRYVISQVTRLLDEQQRSALYNLEEKVE